MLNRFNFKKVISRGLLPLMGLGLLTVPTPRPAAASGETPVSVELMLSVDISGSVDSSEYNLQMDGYAAAFRDDEVIAAIERLPDGMAISLQFWAKKPAPDIGWRVLNTRADILAFADELDALPRPSSSTSAVSPWSGRIQGWTGIANGLEAATTSILENAYAGEVLVIDVSGDGRENVRNWSLIRDARDNAVANNITVNGLPIDPSNNQYVANHYRDYVIGGTDSFAEVAYGFDNFTEAVKTKLQREIFDTYDEFTVPIMSCQVTDSVTVAGTVRDFSDSHPDFQYRIGDDRNMVTTNLGVDRKPIYAHPDGSTRTTNGKEYFDQWYRDINGVNESMDYPITLTKQANDNFRYENTSFFPIDNQMMGNEGRNHNFHFTYEIHSQFTYEGGEVLNFSGDDDVWVYINGQRVIDLGGVHGRQNASVNVDAVAAQLGLEIGQTYDFDFFFAERHTTQSNFVLETSMNLLCDSDGNGISDLVESAPFGDPDGDGFVPIVTPIGGEEVITQDIDEDGVPNWQDPDNDDDGFPDNEDPRPYIFDYAD
ncbi:exported hypothetical protein [Hyella patelloides LEGE 07179]|uniref:PA14 domain-containing protein n=1 Tax=Hyella patelloides LEGE 07179 TaxID=945734 RepID=A0A563VKT3_9CYAN|nr:DUF1194 domain-containing protein [Hyella patelloides]VEP12022.1 exported hypothetical protein [Hyella patelloides LEGE 07179]